MRVLQKRIIYGISGVVVLLLAAALMAPFFLNINNYKSRILSQATEALGREVSIEGNISFSLLPSPKISLEGVRIGNLPGGKTRDMLHLKRLRIFAQWLPLLRKQIKIDTVELDDPQIFLEKRENGQNNWDFTPPTLAVLSENGKSATSSSPQPDIALNEIILRNGRLVYQGGGQDIDIQEINIKAALTSLMGPYNVEGKLKIFEHKIRIAAHMGALESSPGNKRLQSQAVNLTVQGDEGTFRMEGDFFLTALAFKGHLEASGKLEKLLPSLTVPPFLSEPFLIKTEVNATPEEISFIKGKLDLGTAHPRADVKIFLKESLKIEGILDDLPGNSTYKFTLFQPTSQPGTDLQGNIKGTTGHLEAFLVWLGVETPSFASTLSGPLTFSTDCRMGNSVQLEHLNIAMGNAKLSGNASWQGVKEGKPPRLFVNLGSPHIENILRLLGIDFTKEVARTRNAETLKPLGKAQVKATLQGDEHYLNLDVTTLCGSGHMTIKGTAQTLRENPRFDVSLEGGTADLPALMAGLGMTSQGSYGEASVRGKISGDFSDIALDTHLKLDSLSLSLKGGISDLLKSPACNLHVNLFHPNLKNFLGTDYFKGSSGSLSVYSQLQGNARYINLSNLKGKIGNEMEVAGEMTVNRTTGKPDIKIHLATSALDTSSLLAARDREPLPREETGIYLIAAKKEVLPSASRWPQDSLDFGFLNKFDADIKISAPKLIHNELRLSQVQLIAKVQKGRLDISPLSGSIYGGDFIIKGQLTSDNLLHIDMTLKDADLKDVFAHNNSVKIVKGKLFATTSLSTRGKSIDQMVHNLAGPVSIKAQDGLISGFDLPALSQRLGNLKNIQSLLGLFDTFTQKGQTPFSSFTGDIMFKDGRGTIQSMKVIAKEAEGKAAGYIDLPRYVLDIMSEIRLTEHSHFPPFRLRLTGPLDNPSRQVDTSALQKYMMDNIFKDVISRLGKGQLKPADIFGSLMGGKGASPQKSPEPARQPTKEASKPDKPEQIVKGLLKNLF